MDDDDVLGLFLCASLKSCSSKYMELVGTTYHRKI